VARDAASSGSGARALLSQLKPLDVRLDEMIGQAIHPDPARRPASALELRACLEEIRDSRPRLSGTPLVTPAVRAADFAWTVLGLYVCAAGFCATLSQTRTPVPALLDLRFGCSGLLIAGFLAVWVLSLLIGVLSLWQILRLWRFPSGAGAGGAATALRGKAGAGAAGGLPHRLGVVFYFRLAAAVCVDGGVSCLPLVDAGNAGVAAVAGGDTMDDGRTREPVALGSGGFFRCRAVLAEGS
jgi:hypothetical protein